MNKEGKVLNSCAKLYNSREGFEQFVKMTEGLRTKHRLKDVLIGMEPTGHYWRKLAYFSKEQGYEVRFVRTTALKHHREIDESSSAKSDRRDALTIANITKGRQVHRYRHRRWSHEATENIGENTGKGSPVQCKCKKCPACGFG